MSNGISHSLRKFRRKPLITALEPRVLLDGAAVATTAEMATDVDHQESDSQATTESMVHFAAPAPTGNDGGQRREVAFVDRSVEDSQELADGLGDNVEVIYLDADANGLEQMVASLEGQQGIDAIHVLSHGGMGEVKLGSLSLNGENLQANAELLSTLGESLTESGDLMLYGCYVGADSEGQDFIDSLADLTRTDVAASSDLTGSEGSGGDWELEVSSGQIDASALAPSSFEGRLNTLIISSLDDLHYTEGDGEVLIDGDVSISGSTDYTGGYLDFRITDANSSESLGFANDSVASTNDGQLSIVGNTVYRGDGSNATVIGSVDATLNGQNGQPLRINFSNAFENGDFQDGSNGDTVINGWTAVSEKIRLNGVDEIAGQATPIDQTYPSSNGSIGDDTSGGSFSQTAKLSNYAGTTSSDLAVELDTGSSSINEGFGVIRGPYVFSDGTVSLQAGDQVSFDWKALSGGDAYDAYGYIVDVNTGQTVTILDSTGTTSNQETIWAKENITIGDGQEGVYRFVFVAGSYDFTGGRYVGGKLMIDDVKVTQANPPGPIDDVTLSSLTQRVTYTNSALDQPALTRNLTVSVQDKNGDTGNQASQIFLSGKNNSPTFTNDAQLPSVNEDTVDPRGATIESIFDSLFSDPDTQFDPADALAGVVITEDASSSSQGEWQYSTDGTNWYAVGPVDANNGLLLSLDTSLRFVPVADYNGTPGGLSVHAVDSSDSALTFTDGASRESFDSTLEDATGGDTAVSSNPAKLTTTIISVNDAPVLDKPADQTVTDTADNDDFDDLTGTLAATDIDSARLTYGIDGGSDDGAYVTLAGAYGTLQVTKATGAYTFIPSSSAINGLNTTESEAFTVTVSDGELTNSQVLEFTLEGANDNPVFEADSGSTQVSVFSYPNLNGNDSAPGTANENANLASIVQWVINEGGDYTLDTAIQNFTDADFADKLNASGFFFMTDMESGDPSSTAFLPESAKTAIRDWVDAGGVIMMTGTAGNRDTDFLNTIFNWDLTTENGSSWSLNEANAAGTPFAGGPASLSSPSATDSIGRGTVDGFNAIYGDESNATVATIGYGAGNVIFMGYDYYSSGISGTGFTETATQYGDDVVDGSTRNDGWVREIIPRALQYSADLSADTLLTESDAALTSSGQLSVSDVDQPDSVAVSVSGLIAEQRGSDGEMMASSELQPDVSELLAMLDTGSQPSIDSTATSGDVSWTFNSKSETFDYLAAGESLVLTYELTADDGNGGMATRTLTITINGTNDAPVSQDFTKNVAENGVFTGVADAIDVDGTIENFELLSDVSSGSLNFNPDGSYSFDPGTAFDDLAEGESRAVTFTYRATDNAGAASQLATVTLTVVGSNDVPVVSAGSGSAAENGSLSSHVPAASDVDGTIASYQVATDVAEGQLTFNIDGTYAFAANSDFDDLAVGESRQVTFTYTATDNDGGISAPGTVTLTITGTNDSPTIRAEASAPITEVPGDSSAQPLSDSGEIAFDDLDTTDVVDIAFADNGDIAWSGGSLDPALASTLVGGFSIPATTGAAAPGSVDWSYDVSDVDLDFLADGETLTFSYDVTATDSQGATATETVSFTITGTNDAPSISAEASAPITEVPGDSSAQPLSDSGQIAFDDLDTTDVVDITFTDNGDIAWSGGSLDPALASALVGGFSIPATTGAAAPGSVGWSYDVSDVDLDFLAEGETLTFSYDVTATDSQGATATDTVSFTITGTNDAPAIIAEASAPTTEVPGDSSTQALSDSGEILFDDLDTTDVVDITFADNGDINWSGGSLDPALASALVGGFTIPATTDAGAPGSVDWAYALNDVDLDFLADGETLTFSYDITATDSQGATATDTVSFTITGTNDTPVLNLASEQEFVEDADGGSQSLSQNGRVEFVDTDLNDRISISFDSNKDIRWAREDGSTVADLPDGLANTLVNGFAVSGDNLANEGQVEWQFSADDLDLDFLNAGDTLSFSYTVRATDSEGASAAEVITVVVQGTNDAPEMTSRQLTDAETIVQQGAGYTLDVSTLFSDKDSELSGERLQFDISGLPKGLSYNSDTGVISGKPTQPGPFSITVTARDASGTTLSRTFGMTVTAVVSDDGGTPTDDTGTPPAAPETDIQPVDDGSGDGGLPDGLVGQVESGDPADASGFISAEPIVEGTGSAESDNTETSADAGESGNESGSSQVQPGERVLIAEEGVLVVQNQNPDGNTTTRASVDVNVGDDGQVVFSDIQREAFSAVSLSVASIGRTSESTISIDIEDTSPNAGSQMFSGSLADGQSLPSWIQVDPATGSVTIGTPPAGQSSVDLRVQAVGSDGQVRILELKLDLEELLGVQPSGGELEPATQPDVTGYQPLADQLEAEFAARDDYGNRLLTMLEAS